MGRLPAQWAGKVITDRFPYSMAAELRLTTGQIITQFAASSFLHSIDKPFEIHRLIPRVIAQDSEGLLLTTQPDQELLASLVRLLMTNLGINQPMMPNATRISVLTKGSSERTWEYAEPYYLKNGQEIIASAQALTFPAISGLSSLMVVLDFQGFLIQVSPPSDIRG